MDASGLRVWAACLSFEQATHRFIKAGQEPTVCVRKLNEIGAEQSIELLLAEVDGPGDQEEGKEQTERADQDRSQGVSPSSSKTSKSNGVWTNRTVDVDHSETPED
jgi:hypothetical protein